MSRTPQDAPKCFKLVARFLFRLKSLTQKAISLSFLSKCEAASTSASQFICAALPHAYTLTVSTKTAHSAALIV
jgi:hypothetical protein